jgi:hypothetical protein
MQILQESYEVTTISYECYSKRPFVHKVISNILTNILQFRFSEVHNFKKHQLKKKYKKMFQMNNYDKVNSWIGFPFPKSNSILNFLYKVSLNLKSWFQFDEVPDLVLITGCQEGFAQYILKWADSKNIPAISLINSCDHLTFRGPVYKFKNIKKYLVWGNIQKEELIKFHDVPDHLISISSSPQFDYLYELKKLKTNREQIGLQKDEFVVFLPAYNERHGFNEPEAVERIYQYILSLNIPFKIVLRPYPKDQTFNLRFETLLNKENIFVNEIDENFIEDRKKISLFLKHCNVVVCGPGTVAIEAMYFNKPVVFLAMENRPNFANIKIAKERYFTDHFQNVAIPGGSYFCETWEQMLAAFCDIRNGNESYLDVQKQILKMQIDNLEGNASKFILEEVNKILD